MSGPTGHRVPDRREGIGASAVAAIMGVSPWRTPVDEWLDKQGLAADQPETLRMRAGHALEPLVLEELRQRSGLPFRANRVPRRHPRWDQGVRLFATPDGIAMPFLAECKTGRTRWENGLPAFVKWQVVAQLACFPRAEGVYVARLAEDNLEVYLVERDPSEVEYLERYVADWWEEHVVEGRVPDPPEGKSDNVFFGPEVNATPEQEAAWAHLRALRAEIDALTAAAEEIKAGLAAPQADIVGNGWRGRWVVRQSTSWKDVATAAGADPRLVAAYTRVSSTFDVRATKEREP